MNIKKFLILPVLALASVSAFAENDKPVAGGFMNYPQDAYTMSIGGTSMSGRITAFTVNDNPASMALSDKRFDIGVNYMNWKPSSSHMIGLSTYFKLGDRVAMSVTGQYLTYPKISGSGIGGGFTSDFAPKEMYFKVGLGVRIIDGLSIGANLKYIGSFLANKDLNKDAKGASAFGADISLMYQIKGVNISLGVNNLGSKLKYGTTDIFTANSLASSLRLGVGYNAQLGEKHDLNISLEGDYLFANEWIGGAGLEYVFNDMVYVRGGYHYGESLNVVQSYGAVGIGLRFAGVTIDGTYMIPVAKNSMMKNTFAINLGYAF